jgi:predicted DNA-binding transcriptional regulator AlpA
MALELVHGFEPLLGTREVAEILGVSQNRARDLNLPWVKVGGRLRLEPSDIRAWIDSHRERVA